MTFPLKPFAAIPLGIDNLDYNYQHNHPLHIAKEPFMIRVLFVCLGNICRSPTAEGVFRDLVGREGLSDKITTDSCGTSGWHRGDPPDNRARQEARRRGIDIEDLKSRETRQRDFVDFDFIIAMDDNNFQTLHAMSPAEHATKIHMFLSFAPSVGVTEVPDPYYGGPDGFSDVFDMIDVASKGLLQHIRDTHL
jgi:protein-tyrosine phosphatase